MLCRCAQGSLAPSPVPSLQFQAVLALGLQPIDGVTRRIEVAAWGLPATLCAHLHQDAQDIWTIHPHSTGADWSTWYLQGLSMCQTLMVESAASTYSGQHRVLNMQICDGCRKVGLTLTVRFEGVLMCYPSVRRLRCDRQTLKAEMLEVLEALRHAPQSDVREHTLQCIKHSLES